MNTPPRTYKQWFSSVFGIDHPGRPIIATSWHPDTKWGQKAHSALQAIEVECAEELLLEAASASRGAVVEFGIYQGAWINHFAQIIEKHRLSRDVYGFDSFEGLSQPDEHKDSSFWKRGMYACDIETVSANVKAAKRPFVHLIKGWFSESLQEDRALSIREFCFARIDCDIYAPALQCLKYLGPRLADRAILVFDDWPHSLGTGEQQAFQEWINEVPQLRFEFLFYNTWGHLYLRVHRT